MIGLTYAQLLRAHFGVDDVFPYGTESLADYPVDLAKNGLVVQGDVVNGQFTIPTKINIHSESIWVEYDDGVLGYHQDVYRWNSSFQFWE